MHFHTFIAKLRHIEVEDDQIAEEKTRKKTVSIRVAKLYLTNFFFAFNFTHFCTEFENSLKIVIVLFASTSQFVLIN